MRDYGALVLSSLLLPAGHGLGGSILPDAPVQDMLPTTGPKQMDPVAPGLFSRKLRQNDCLQHFFLTVMEKLNNAASWLRRA